MSNERFRKLKIMLLHDRAGICSAQNPPHKELDPILLAKWGKPTRLASAEKAKG